jgi:glycosyltransferase involved in cell wall biosynthesis
MGVFPSTCLETYGLVLDECFELGLPCIVRAIGALEERAGRAALAVPSGDSAALAAAMGSVLARPELRDHLAQHLPPLSPEPAEHWNALRALYARALASSHADAASTISPRRRAAFLLMQRESAQGRVTPEGGPR